MNPRSWFALALALSLLVVSSGKPLAAEASAMESRLDVGGGIELRVVRWSGAQDRTPVIFVPGWSFGADVWADQMARIGEGRTVVSFDPRSQGLSTITTEGNTPEQRAQDLHALIASLKLDRPPVIVAWSQGVQDMAAYVQRYGDSDLAGVVLVDAAVAAGGAASPGPEQDEGRRRMELYAARPRDYLQGMMGFIISRPQPEGAIDAYVETGLRTPPGIGRAMLEADFAGADRTGALARFTRPVLVIASARSPELETLRTQAATAHARLETVDDAAHAVFLDQPDRFAGLLRDFLKPLDER